MYAEALKPVRVAISRCFSFMLLATIWLDTIIAAKSPVTSVVIEQQERDKGFAVTFAHPFKKGDVKDTLLLKTGNEVIPSQVNVKRRYSDGSVKHAIISAFISEAVPGLPLTLDIYSSGEQAVVDPIVPHLPEGFSAEVIFDFPDGSQRRANAAEFYRKASSGIDSFRLVRWLQGPLTSEVQLVGPPSGTNGELDPDLQVIFGLRAFKGGKCMRVEVVVESPWVDVPGNIPYDVTVFVGGKKVMVKTDVGYWNHRMPYWLKEKD